MQSFIVSVTLFYCVLQYEYALRHLYALVNLCEGGYEAKR